MAVEQSPFSRSVTLPTTQVSTGSGLTQLAGAASEISQLVTEKINDVAIGQASLQGEQDVQNEVAPEKLALPFTKATKAYNNAVIDTEYRRTVQSAQDLINESLVNNTNPATFGRETPAKFKAELDGIESGFLEGARPETREKLRDAIKQMSSGASLKMLQHSISYDNQQTNFNFQKDMDVLLEAGRNAAIAGDTDRLAGVYDALNQTLNNYSILNAGIAQKAPYLKHEIESHQAVDKVLMGYSEALHNKTTATFLSNLAENKENLPFNVWDKAVKAVIGLDQTEKRLKNDVNAIQMAQVNAGIENGTITDPSDVLNFQDLTVPQTIAQMSAVEKKNAQTIKDNSDVITAQQNILFGRSSFNSSDITNKMFKSAINGMQEDTGQIATLRDMEASALGLNNYPASGLPGTPVGRNIPALDSAIEAKLTSGDPLQIADAALVFNDMVNTRNKPNSVSLSGNALAIASLFNELNVGGIPVERAAELANEAVLHAKDSDVAQRIERFHKEFEKVDRSTGRNKLENKYKDLFGYDAMTFGNDEAFRVFSDIYRSNFISSSSEEGAFNATKYAMRSWGTSPYFEKGVVSTNVPEKEVPITRVGHAFDNQLVSNVQGFINRNNAAREQYSKAHPNQTNPFPVIEWANPKQIINFSESQADKVFKKMTIGSAPRIKINGLETDVKLISSATSRLGNVPNWILGVYDQFNNFSPLRDLTNDVDQVARFSPQELSVWAPQIATKQTDDALRSVAEQIRKKEVQAGDAELKQLQKDTPAWQVVFGVARPDDYLKFLATRNANTGEGRLAELVSQLKQRGAEVTDNEITEADNVGISPDLISAGNIDLSNRPRVKRANGKTSTVDSIGIEQDGKHYVIPQISDDGEVLTPKEAVDLFHKTGKHLGVFKTQKAADKFAQKLHESEAKKLNGEENIESSIPPIDKSNSESKESSIASIPKDKELKPKVVLSDEAIGRRQVKRETSRSTERETRTLEKDFESNAKIIFPSLSADDMKKAVSLIDFAKSNINKEVAKALDYVAQSIAKKERKEQPSKPEDFEKVTQQAHKNLPLLNKTIRDIKSLSGNVDLPKNKKIIKQVQTLYPHLNVTDSKKIIRTLNLILNKKRIKQ